jgi:hypothetical protein
MFSRLILLITLCFSLHSAYADDKTSLDNVINLSNSLSKSLDTTQDNRPHEHIIKTISEDRSLLTLEDGMSFKIKWWYNPFNCMSTPKAWKVGDRIYIVLFDNGYCHLRHPSSKNPIMMLLQSYPYPSLTIKSFPQAEESSPEAYSQVMLNDGAVFRAYDDHAFSYLNWQTKDKIVVFANSDTVCQLWNLDKNYILYARFLSRTNPKQADVIKFQDILGMEARLNEKVLQQPEATKSVVTSLLNYAAGLKNRKSPIGVFLFLGSTGVGKTELAKVLTHEIYKDSKKMLRFDMSHFSESNAITKLVGSPPGYVNHEEGGQLTSPLLENSQVVVLLDEVDKAHLQVMQMFLTVFDEGMLVDNKNNQIDCSETIFILTSNFCGEEIAKLYRMGYNEGDILAMIEPALMTALSPELYNRVEVVLFKPLAQETMRVLVEMFLKQVKEKLWVEKGINISFDETLINFLIENGYHPLLGARPLKKLIEKRVVSALAYSIIHDSVEEGDYLGLSYCEEENLVVVK